MTSRAYQDEAVAAAVAYLEDWRSPLLHMATGTGKTTVGARIVADQVSKGRRTLWLAHRIELIEQATQRMRQAGLVVGVEQGKTRAAGDCPVVVSTVQTMVRRLDGAGFGFVVVDEAHHAGAKSYRTILDHYGVPWLGLTATPGRADGAKLGHDGVAYTYGIREAVRDGYLVRPVGLRVRCALRPDELRTSRGDYTDASAALCIQPGLPEYCAGVAEQVGELQTIAFLPTVETAHAAAEVWRRLGLTAEAVDGKTPTEERKRIVAAYQAGEVQVLVNCMIFTEGFDAPETGAVAICRPTKNAGLYQQMAGRALRLAPGKTEGLILDLAGADCDLISETSASAYGETRQATATRRVDICAALDRAEAEAAARARYVAEVEEIDLLTKRKRKPLVKPAALGIEWDESDQRVPSIADARTIMRAGIAPPMSAAEAAAVLGWLARRDGLATASQARRLRQMGCRDDIPREEAAQAMERMAALGWRDHPAMRAALREWRA